jgi:hypothetical protein
VASTADGSINAPGRLLKKADERLYAAKKSREKYKKSPDSGRRKSTVVDLPE